MEQALRPSQVAAGDLVDVRISCDLQSQGCIVFREGTPVTAVVTEAHGPGVVGTPSLIVLEVRSTEAADGTVVPLTGMMRAEGEERTMEAIGAAAGVCCLGIFLPGGHQSIGKGVGTVATTTREVEVRCAAE
jgi:hypothetical protein